jgi:hypothetical protein
MNNFLYHVKRGAGYLEGLGGHPGTPILIGFIIGCALAGANGGLLGVLQGGLIGTAVFLPFWVRGCVERSRDWENSPYNKANK